MTTLQAQRLGREKRMRDSILTIIPAQVSDALRIEALLGACPELRSETVGWDAVAFDWLDRHPARLLVVAPGESWSPALRLFRRIAEHPVAQQVLAFLDERTPVELADTAVEVADD